MLSYTVVGPASSGLRSESPSYPSSSASVAEVLLGNLRCKALMFRGLDQPLAESDSTSYSLCLLGGNGALIPSHKSRAMLLAAMEEKDPTELNRD